MEDLDKRLREAQKRLEQGIAAGNFHKTAEGKLVQDWINERVSYLLNKMTGKTPLSRDEYLSCHGGVKELEDFNIMINAKKRAAQGAAEEVMILNGQAANNSTPR